MGIDTASNFKYHLRGEIITNACSRQLLRHVEEGGSLRDPVGSEIASKFVDGMMLSEDFASLVSLHQFSRDELVYVITIATESGLTVEIPSPCVNDVYPRLLGVVLLQNRDCTAGLLSEARRMESDQALKTFFEDKDKFPNVDVSDRQKLVKQAAIGMVTKVFAKRIYTRITEANGPPEFTVRAGGTGLSSAKPPGGWGCASLIIMGFTLGSASCLWCLVR